MKKTVQTRRGMAPAGRPALDRAVRLVVGRQERAHLGVGREAVARELDGTRLRDRFAAYPEVRSFLAAYDEPHRTVQDKVAALLTPTPVSYTHLTLPTICSV